MIFIIAEKETVERAREQGQYVAASLQTEGFLHCSSKSQVIKIADLKFRGMQTLVLLEVDENKVRPKLRYEGRRERYPHIYGPLNMDAVVRIYRFRPKNDGTFGLPSKITD